MYNIDSLNVITGFTFFNVSPSTTLLNEMIGFPLLGLSNFDHKDIKIIAKRSNILQLSVFIYVFFIKKTDFGKPKRCFYHIRSNREQLITIVLAIENSQ